MTELAQSIARTLMQCGRVRAADFPGHGVEAFGRAVRSLCDAGFDVDDADAAIVSLRAPVEGLDEGKIRRALDSSTLAALARLRVDPVVASTNALALAAEPPAPDRFCAVLSDFQWDGQGRRGAAWRSPPGTGLCLSVALRLPRARDLSTFSLACGVSVRRALLDAGVPGVLLKWPNDLVVDGRKLGGLLVQMRQIPDEPSLLVIGLGLNVTRVPRAVDGKALPPVAVAQLCRAATPSRNELAAAMIHALWRAANEFSADGFAAFDTAWRDADFLRGRAVTVDEQGAGFSGIARGVSARGELLVETSAGVRAVNAGQVSVRPETAP